MATVVFASLVTMVINVKMKSMSAYPAPARMVPSVWINPMAIYVHVNQVCDYILTPGRHITNPPEDRGFKSFVKKLGCILILAR